MRSPRSSLLVPALVFSLFASGCDEPDANQLIEKESTFAEKHEGVTLHWNVDEDGDAVLVVTDEEGQVVTGKVEGELKVAVEDDKEPRIVKLKSDAERGVLTAELNDLDDDLTTIEYELQIESQPIAGALVLPEEGTAALVVESEVEAKPEHGGEIVVVGEAHYEVVANAASGETRVYVIDEHERPEHIELAVDAHEAQRVELEWSDEGYFVADLKATLRPRKVTLLVREHADSHVHVAIVGYHSHVVLELHHAPSFWIVRPWKHHGKARGHYKGTVFGPPGHYKHHHVDVHAKNKHHKVKIKAKDKHDHHDHHDHHEGSTQVSIKSSKKGGAQVKIKAH